MKKIIAIALLVAASAAQAMSGNTLLERMNGNAPEKTNAYGYIAGVGDAYNAAGLVCFPKDATLGQNHDVVKRMLEEMPELRHLEALNLTGEALMLAFPCPKAAKTKTPSL